MYFSKKEEDEIPTSKSFAGSILHDVQPRIKGRKNNINNTNKIIKV